MRKLVILFALLTTVLAISLGISLYPEFKKNASNRIIPTEQQGEDFVKAQEFMESGHPEEALKIIQRHKQEMESLSENGTRWLDLFIAASEEMRDVSQLVHLFEFFPEIFKEKEGPSLLVADSYITNNRVKDYKKIRSLWQDRETKVASWFVLDVDQLLLEGRRSEALELLKTKKFKDKADVGRVVRLALMTANEDPKEAWKYLGEAYAKDPQNPDVRSYRAKLLESVGKYNLAHKEYQAATRLSPKNLFLRDQLADFYLRQKHYPLALKVWQETLTPPSVDKIWVKTLFWEKVTTTSPFDWEETPMPQGRLDPLIQYLLGLKSTTFWDQTTFEHVANATYFLKTQQETFWLRLIQAFKEDKIKEAASLLKYNPFQAVSWYPELEKALKQILAYRESGVLKVEELPLHAQLSDHPEKAELPLFFKHLNELDAGQKSGENGVQIPESYHELLLSKEVFSAAFLAAEWYEAGLQLRALPVIPNEFPSWVSYNIVLAMEHNRSLVEALEFAALQKPTPELSLLTAEMMISGGDTVKALEKLTKLTKADSDIGYRSAWLASLLYIESKDWNNARTVIYSQPRLVKDILGQETLARIAHLEGNIALADKLYTALEKKSPEARSYLARRSFEDKNWKRAKELTELLIEDYPDNPTLVENLKKIEGELRKTGPEKK